MCFLECNFLDWGWSVMKRIEELKQEAMIKFAGHGAFGEPCSYDELDLEKFAELIVEECVSAILDGTNESGWYANKVKEHFGVE